MTAMQQEPFVSLLAAAQSLGVPAAWLKREAKAGRIPHLKAGCRILFNLQLVERALLERAAGREVSPA
jgi:hypothetical protein